MYAADIMINVLHGDSNWINVQVKNWVDKQVSRSVKKESLIDYVTDLQTLILRSVS